MNRYPKETAQIATEQQDERPMTAQTEQDGQVQTREPLSTSDMVAAGQRSGIATTERAGTDGGSPKYIEGEERPEAQAGRTRETTDTPLLGEDEARGFRDRWEALQTSFVDEPQEAVRQADSLVAETIQCVATVFAREKGKLEQQWSGGGQADTEDLRQALRRYRSFFERLLSA